MKCSLKDGFISILLLICITPTKGIELLLHKRSVLDKQMNLQQFRASINRLQDLDSFPENGDNQLHKIVKKQMATCDYKDGKKSKRSVVGFPGQLSGFLGGAGDAADVKHKDETAENAIKDSEVLKSRSADSTDSTGSFLRKLKDFAREKDLLFIKRSRGNVFFNSKDQDMCPVGQEAMKKEKNVEDMLRRLKEKLAGKDNSKEDQALLEQENSVKNPCLTKQLTRFPDKCDCRFYYECESNSNGCLKLRHKRCPRGQFFSNKYLKCLKAPKCRFKKSTDAPCPKKLDILDNGTDDPEPANEWLDASSSNQKIPSEFKPKKKPTLKIYHLRPKRRLDGLLGEEVADNRRSWAASHAAARRHVESAIHDSVRKHGARHHLPRSYIIRVNKKDQIADDDQIAENDENENDNDEEDEETDEEDEDEEADDEDDDGEEEDSKDVTQEKHEVKESIRDLLKSAKAAVTNRARFEDPMEIAARSSSSSKTSSAPSKTNSSLKSKKSSDSTEGKDKKKVLIDANIKVDSTISSVLKRFLNSKRKDKDSANRLTDDYETLAGLRSRDRMEPQGPALYEHLMQNNPRVKRYYLANCAGRGN